MTASMASVDRILGEPLLRGGGELLTGTRVSVLSVSQIRDLHWASLEILERTGVHIEHEDAREMLRGAGARVEGMRVRIPAYLVDSALKTAPGSITFYTRTGKPLAFLGGNRVYGASVNDSPWLLDPVTGERRAFVSDDYRLTVRVAEASPYIMGLTGCGHALDYPVEYRIHVSFIETMFHSTKTFHISTGDPTAVADIIDLAAILAGGEDELRSRPFIMVKAEPTAPLCHVRDSVGRLLLAARKRIPVVYYSMTAAGSTAPCTVAGAIVVANADVLAGLVMHQLAAPGAPFIYGLMPGVLDMSATVWCYGSPDFFLATAAATELSHHYDLPMYGTAGATDAKELDMQAACEVALGCLLGVQSGANLIHNIGQMESDLTTSPALVVLTDEVLGMVLHMTSGINTSPQDLSLDLIDEIGPRGHYLSCDHTLNNFRRFWYPKVFERRRYDVWKEYGGKSVLERLNSRTIKLIEQTEVEPLPEDVAREYLARERAWRGK